MIIKCIDFIWVLISDFCKVFTVNLAGGAGVVSKRTRFYTSKYREGMSLS